MISKRLLYLRMLLPLARLGWEYLESEDVWVRHPHRVPLQLLGSGCVRELSWFLEGETSVPIRSVADVCRWLRRCQYVHDEALFNERDFWQHPRTFEQIRRGDCEDHALWAWRKLRELGLPAEFMVGRWGGGDAGEGGMHAWVVFRESDTDYLLESVAKTRADILRPLSSVRSRYAPHFSVDAELTIHMYGGFFQFLQNRGKARRADVPPAAGTELV